MEKPLISIVTITWNAADVLPDTMDSVAEQTFRNFEHLIIDGASVDHTLQIARDLGGEAVRVVSERDKGLYDAMNKGLHLALGKYVLFLNAGDSFANPNVLRKYAEAAEEYAKSTENSEEYGISAENYWPDIIYGDTVIVDATRNIKGPRHLSVPEILTFECFSEGMLICHQAFMVRRAIAPDYDLTYRFSADYDWTIRCILATTPERCINLHEVTIHYLDDGLTEKNKKASLKERFNVMRKHYGTLKAVSKHISFIPRAIRRKISGNGKG